MRKLYPDGDVKVEVAGRAWVLAAEAVERLVSMASLMRYMNDPAGVAESAAHVAELMQMLRDADSSAPLTLSPSQPPTLPGGGSASSDGPAASTSSSCAALRAAAFSSSVAASSASASHSHSHSHSHPHSQSHHLHSASGSGSGNGNHSHQRLSPTAYEESMRAGWRETLVACVGRGDADRSRALLSQLAFELEPHKEAAPSSSSCRSSSGSGSSCATSATAAAPASSSPLTSADLNVLVNGQGAIHVAAQNGFLEILQMLLEHRADIELEDKYAIHFAHLLNFTRALMITAFCLLPPIILIN